LENKNLIPFFGVARQYQNLREEILDVTDKVYTSGQVLDGNYTTTFEQAIAVRCNRKYAISVNSCTQGLIFALQCLKMPGRVVIPTISFVATLNSVLATPNIPEFVDVDYNGLMDLKNANFSLRGRNIAAIMYPNLFGNTIDYDKFRVLTEFVGESPLIIEDAAQSFGASYKGIPSGKMGDISVLSFDPTKNLPNYGSGGMILTDDQHFAVTVRNLRDNGKMSMHSMGGTNSKMSESDCAQMLVKLGHFDRWQDRRDAIAKYYTQQLSPYMDVLGPNEDVEHAWHKFVLRITSRRSKLVQHLKIKGIETKIHYSSPLDTLMVGANYAHDGVGVTGAQFSKETLSIPIYPELTDSEVEYIAAAIKEFYC
jgi:dTDP-4-amino-4,6-dideoxygalactose transaminase